MRNDNSTPQPGEKFFGPAPYLGDSGVTGTVFAVTQEGVHRCSWLYLMSRGEDRDHARDLAQAVADCVLDDALKNPKRFRKAFRIIGYVQRISESRRLDHYRRQRALKKKGADLEALVAQDQEGGDEYVDPRLGLHQLLQADESGMLRDRIVDFTRAQLWLLSPMRQLVFRMQVEEGKSRKEVAEELGLSQNTVKMHFGMALWDLRVALVEAGLIKGIALPGLSGGVNARSQGTLPNDTTREQQ